MDQEAGSPKTSRAQSPDAEAGQPDNVDVADDMEVDNESKPRVCSVCLAFSGPLYSMVSLGLAPTYTLLSGLTLPKDAPLELSVCSSCAALLRKTQKLADSTKRAHELLMPVVENRCKVTIEDLRRINLGGDRMLIRGSLVTTHFRPGYFDVHIKADDVSLEERHRLARPIIEKTVMAAVQQHVSAMRNMPSSQRPTPTATVTRPPSWDARIDEASGSGQDQNEDEGATNEPEAPPPNIDDSTQQYGQQSGADAGQENQWVPSAEDNVEEGLIQDQTDEDKETLTATDFRKFFKVKKLSLQEQIMEQKKGQFNASYVDAQYKCIVCYKGFKVEDSYTTHMLKHNKISGSRECPVCHIWMGQRRTQVRHNNTHNTQYTCLSCDWQTNHRSSASLHAKWHQGTVYKCDICTDSIVFTRQSSLLSHMRMHHPMAQVCAHCGFGFINEKGLRRHMQLKHAGEEQPSSGPACVECDLTFASEDALDKHRQVHHERLDDTQPDYAQPSTSAV